ncbi:polysaccharide deacetylase [Pedobacter sp. V48]|uniref:polysaccharide deacetylase family protein n=1 Tax=Pedobacter sp. V48 TaxID=509635 RepID=UPI001267F122|nr:polysaccharide deacetylase [Pedobacter sp. V48]
MKRILYLLMVLAIPCSAQVSIEGYNKYFAITKYNNNELLILRKFKTSGTASYLAVNPTELSTSIIPAATVTVKEMGLEEALTYFGNTPYAKTVSSARQLSSSLQDAGIIHGFQKEKGITLTIDLCPSHKALDRIIFTSLISEFQKTEKPVPIAISITGRWMLTHSNDLNWLKELEKSNDIKVTWINHSYNHHVSSKAPLKTNFLLEPGTDLNFEILGTELAMLQHGMIPSVFFRFPGLVSDTEVVKRVLSYGVIPVGSDAWLAKGQPANSGSIVLIHGNGNEPLGVQDFIKLLKNKQKDIQGKQWMMYDLRESVEDEFQQK